MNSDLKYFVPFDFTVYIYLVIGQTQSKIALNLCLFIVGLLISISSFHEYISQGPHPWVQWSGTIYSLDKHHNELNIFFPSVNQNFFRFTIYLDFSKFLSLDINHIWWPVRLVCQEYPNLTVCLYLNCECAILTNFTFNFKDQSCWYIPLENDD